MNDYNKINGGFLAPDYIPIKERNKDEMINELKCEVNRLNNIINTFEDDLERELRTSEENSGLEYKEYILIKSTLKKVLKNFRELKESDNNE